MNPRRFRIWWLNGRHEIAVIEWLYKCYKQRIMESRGERIYGQ